MSPTRLVIPSLLGLLAGGLIAVTTASPAAAEIYAPRWCSEGAAAPCLVSATRNGVPLSPSDPDYEVQMVGVQTIPSRYYTGFLVQRTNALDSLSLTDTFSLTFDLGTLQPDTTESYASRPVVSRVDDGDGTYRATFTGKPVLLTSGCTSSFPVTCPESADDEDVLFTGEIAQVREGLDLAGFDRSQNADSVDLVFNAETPDRPMELETTWGNSHFLSDGTTVVHGEARFRMPYTLLTSSFGIPDPATMTASSLAGSINGAPAAFTYTHDPAGGAIYVDISGVTFSQKTIRVRTGTITPTKPKLSKVKRVNPRKARIRFAAASPRGAKVTGYQARCKGNGKTLYGVGKRNAFKKGGVTVTGLARGRVYTCSVRAKSKAGPGKWSKAKRA